MRTVRDLVARQPPDRPRYPGGVTPHRSPRCARLRGDPLTPAELSTAVRAAVQAAVDAGDLAVAVPDEVKVERPKVKEHGDYATSVALQLAKPAGRPPREVAEAVAAQLRQADGVVRGRRRRARASSTSPSTRPPRASWPGRSSTPASPTAAAQVSAGQRFNLEFVSANPTGPLHLGHVRWAAVGDALAPDPAAHRRRGRRASTTSTTPACRSTGSPARCSRPRMGKPTPEDGYGGAYIGEIAAAVVEADPTVLDLPDDEAAGRLPARRHGADVHGDPQVARRLRRPLRRLLQREGPARQGRARRRPCQRLTAAGPRLRAGRRDLAAHDRLRRRQGPGAGQEQRRADVLPRRLRLLPRQAGARLRQGRHHARRRPPRLRRPLQGAGRGLRRRPRRQPRDPHRAAGQPVPGRQAAADEQAGRHHRHPRGAGRGHRRRRRPLRAGALLHRLDRSTSTSTCGRATPTTTRSSTCSTRTPGSPACCATPPTSAWTRATLRPELLDHDREGDLLGALGEFPQVVATAAELREPHRVARYLEELAGTYHRFYDACRVLPRGDEEATDTHRARLWLVEATRVVLANGLATARRQRARADVAVRRCAPTRPGPGPASSPTRACTPARRPTSAHSTRPSGRSA